MFNLKSSLEFKDLNIHKKKILIKDYQKYFTIESNVNSVLN